MVAQFADRCALWRGLVQNSIDAGTTRIDAVLTWEEDAGDPSGRGTLRAQVIDDGCGMDRGVIERALLVLFRSTKDGDRTKIGKFGVGFYSVFAIGPEA